MKKLAPVILLLIVSACAGTAEVRATNALAIACMNYDAALEYVTPKVADGTISDANVVRIDQANAIVDTVCLPGSIVDPNSAVAVVRNGINLLNSIKGGS